MTTDRLRPFVRAPHRRRAVRLAVLLASGSFVAAAAAPRQAPTPERYAAHQIACAPRALRSMNPPSRHLAGSPIPGRRLFGTGDLVLVDRGSDDGLAVDQEFFVRRLVSGVDRATGRRDPWLRVHTAGWIRLVEVKPLTAVGKVLYACDAMEPGDFLEPFAWPEAPAPADTAGTPDYAHAGRVIFGDDRRAMAGPATFVVIDRGAEHDLATGQAVTFFRRAARDPETITVLASGTVVVVLPESATVRVERATEPILVGDLAAPHRR
jgi:hypothetical protein